MTETSGTNPEPEGADEGEGGISPEEPAARREKPEDKPKDGFKEGEIKNIKFEKNEGKEFKNEKFEKNEKWEKDEKEGKNEKELKNEKEKPEQKEKDEKELKNEKSEKLEKNETKNEAKEFKNEKWEKDEKEGKNEKEFKSEKREKDEKEGKGEFKDNKNEGKEFPDKPPQFEGRFPDEDILTLPVSRESLVQQAEKLEEAARVLRHFIEQSERPDLRRGALSNEGDQEDDG